WVHYQYSSKLVPWLKEHASEFDVVIINGLWNFTALGARLALTGSNVPYFVFTHGMLDPWFRSTYPLKNILKQILWWVSEGPLLAGAKGVLFTCEDERVLARNAFWPYHVKEFVVGYGTSVVEGDVETQQRQFRDVIPALRDRRFLLFLSRIHPKKGCDLLIDAFALLATKDPGLDLVMAGPDQTGWVQQLKQQAIALGISNRVHWPGMLEGNEKWGAFRASEAFVLPSHQENFGIVVAEALACGKLVLISNKVNIWREVQSGGGGFVADDDAAGVKDLLTRFSDLSPDQRKSMETAARETFLSQFDISKNVSKLVDVLREKDLPVKVRDQKHESSL
ncbi:MAG: glycosyl transferase group 1, partial [Tardiphaga sp.]|nr:glycosyl transferase group 1 [Tardiphaga sp.]